eukprot:gene57593-biopygen112038
MRKVLLGLAASRPSLPRQRSSIHADRGDALCGAPLHLCGAPNVQLCSHPACRGRLLHREEGATVRARKSTHASLCRCVGASCVGSVACRNLGTPTQRRGSVSGAGHAAALAPKLSLRRDAGPNRRRHAEGESAPATPKEESAPATPKGRQRRNAEVAYGPWASGSIQPPAASSSSRQLQQQPPAACSSLQPVAACSSRSLQQPAMPCWPLLAAGCCWLLAAGCCWLLLAAGLPFPCCRVAVEEPAPDAEGTGGAGDAEDAVCAGRRMLRRRRPRRKQVTAPGTPKPLLAPWDAGTPKVRHAENPTPARNTAPGASPTEAPTTIAPGASPTEAPTTIAPGASPTEAPTTIAPVMACPSTPFTTAVVATHADAVSCWVIIDGNVYDVTTWMNGAHPGGKAPILSQCGGDAAAAFNGNPAHKAKKPKGAHFCIGVLATAAPITGAPVASPAKAPTTAAPTKAPTSATPTKAPTTASPTQQ